MPLLAAANDTAEWIAFLRDGNAVMWIAIVLIVAVSTIPAAIARTRRARAETEAIVRLAEQGHTPEEIDRLLKRTRG